MVMALAGRAAEELVFGRVTNGAANDLERATQIARAMVFEWGMGETLTSRTARADDFGLSEETKRVRDQEQVNLTDHAYAESLRLLRHAPRRARSSRSCAARTRDAVARRAASTCSRASSRTPAPPTRSASFASSASSVRHVFAPDWPIRTDRLVLRPFRETRLRRRSTRSTPTRASRAGSTTSRGRAPRSPSCSRSRSPALPSTRPANGWRRRSSRARPASWSATSTCSGRASSTEAASSASSSIPRTRATATRPRRARPCSTGRSATSGCTA